MKKIFSVDNTSNKTDIALLILRVGVVSLMLTHGIPKMLMFLSDGPIKFPPLFGMSANLSLGLAVFAEVFCSIFILVGLAARIAVLPLIVTMLVAVLLIHSADPFAVKEPALFYLLVYIVLFFAGSGKYSIDNLLQQQQTVRSKNTLTDQSVAAYQ